MAIKSPNLKIEQVPSSNINYTSYNSNFYQDFDGFNPMSYSFFKNDVSNSFPNKNYDDVLRHKSTVYYIFYDSSKMVKIKSILLLNNGKQNAKDSSVVHWTEVLTTELIEIHFFTYQNSFVIIETMDK